MPLPIYSRRLWAVHNFAGSYALANPGPNLYIVRTVTVFWGGLSAAVFELLDENSSTMLYAELAPGGTLNQVWSDLRLVWPAGATWSLSSTFGLDMTGHGYELTP